MVKTGPYYVLFKFCDPAGNQQMTEHVLGTSSNNLFYQSEAAEHL